MCPCPSILSYYFYAPPTFLFILLHFYVFLHLISSSKAHVILTVICTLFLINYLISLYPFLSNEVAKLHLENLLHKMISQGISCHKAQPRILTRQSEPQYWFRQPCRHKTQPPLSMDSLMSLCLGRRPQPTNQMFGCFNLKDGISLNSALVELEMATWLLMNRGLVLARATDCCSSSVMNK